MFTLMTLFAVALQTSSEGHHDGSHLLKCAKVCSECQVTCDACFKHCLTLTGESKEKHAKTAQYCVDCAECCKACATLCARNSPLAPHMLECCAQCCDDCAKSCESMPDDKHMAECAKTCRDCAKHCRDAAKSHNH